MKLSDIVIGTKLELELFDDLGDRISPTLVSEFERFDSEDSVYIAAPIKESVIYPIHVGTLMNVYFFSKGVLYVFKAQVVDRGNIGNIAVLRILAKSEIMKIQRRQFFRFECSIPLVYSKQETLMSKKHESPVQNGVTRDISGGGIRMVTADNSLKTGDNLYIDLFLDEESVISFLGKVLRVEKLENDVKYNTELGIKFHKIKNKDRDIIVKYIFKQQRKLRTKGLI